VIWVPTVPAIEPFAASRRGRSGQALIESCLVIAMTALLLLGMLQLSQLVAAREILMHAAARGARARTVGLNRFMVEKVVDLAAIPNSGRMLVPDDYVNENIGLRNAVAGRPGEAWDFAVRTTPAAEQAAIEIARMPEYLGADNYARAHFVLDYDRWPHLGQWIFDSGGADASMTHVHTYQNTGLWVPMHRTFYAADEMDVTGDSVIETHYPLYLEDMGW
jgi:hypothetical protein